MTNLKSTLSVLLLFLCGCSSTSDKQPEAYWTKGLENACEDLASSYPIDPTSKTESSFGAFNRYFSKGGLVDNYENTAPLKNQESEAITSHLKTVKKIRDFFYKASPLNASLPINIKTLKGPQQVQSVQLFFGDSIGPSMSGPRLQYAYTWSKSSPPITLEALNFSNAYWQQSFEGTWALFRFLDNGTIAHKNGHSIASIPIGGNAYFVYIIQGWPDLENIRKTFLCP